MELCKFNLNLFEYIKHCHALIPSCMTALFIICLDKNLMVLKVYFGILFYILLLFISDIGHNKI